MAGRTCRLRNVQRHRQGAVSFQRLRSTIKDKFALALIAAVVKDLQSERDALHTGNAGSGP